MKKSLSGLVMKINVNIAVAAFVFSAFMFLNTGIYFAQSTSQSRISDKIFQNTMVRMTWQEVKQAADNKAIVLVPISVVEEHGPHMDLSPDILIGSHISSVIKEELEKDGIKVIITPPYYWGISPSTGSFPGTFNIKENTMKLLLSDIVENMTNWGFERFYFISSHGDPLHNQAIARIAESLNSSKGPKVYDLSKIPDSPNSLNIPSETPGMYSPDYHAAAGETKMMWKLEPSIIRMEKINPLKPQNNFAPLGYAGDPANFMRSKGDVILDAVAKSYAQKIKNHLSVSADTKD